MNVSVMFFKIIKAADGMRCGTRRRILAHSAYRFTPLLSLIIPPPPPIRIT
ncbi:MAG: hypothetical protein LBD58_03955 [Treponema sp.]|nr:hypothetical protein [Treponema sp.]